MVVAVGRPDPGRTGTASVTGGACANVKVTSTLVPAKTSRSKPTRNTEYDSRTEAAVGKVVWAASGPAGGRPTAFTGSAVPSQS